MSTRTSCLRAPTARTAVAVPGYEQRSDGRPVPRQRSPMEILDERFARGEIDEDEYHTRQAVLRANERGPRDLTRIPLHAAADRDTFNEPSHEQLGHLHPPG